MVHKISSEKQEAVCEFWRGMGFSDNEIEGILGSSTDKMIDEIYDKVQKEKGKVYGGRTTLEAIKYSLKE